MRRFKMSHDPMTGISTANCAEAVKAPDYST